MSLKDQRSRLTAEEAALPWIWLPPLGALLLFKGFPAGVRWTPELKGTIWTHCGLGECILYAAQGEDGESELGTFALHANALFAVEMSPDLEAFFRAHNIDVEEMDRKSSSSKSRSRIPPPHTGRGARAGDSISTGINRRGSDADDF